MSLDGFSFLNVFLGILGFGLSIIFCTTFCRVCSRFREEQIQREVLRRREQEGHARNIYFIPFPRTLSHQDIEDPRGPELHIPPAYLTDPCGPPPAYNELGIKPEDLPPAYTEQSPIPPPPPRTDTPPSQAPSQP